LQRGGVDRKRNIKKGPRETEGSEASVKEKEKFYAHNSKELWKDWGWRSFDPERVVKDVRGGGAGNAVKSRRAEESCGSASTCG